MIRGIHHTALSTPDLERALRFYRDLLGFHQIMDYEWPPGTTYIDDLTALRDSSARVVMLSAGNAMLELFEYRSPQPREADPHRPVNDHGITHICIDVVDLDAEYHRLVAAGMRFHCEPQDQGVVKTVYGRDPDGNVIELQELVGEDNFLALSKSAT
jgi:catechol 2,3-dioxygenase-like lactoylglutathione lyase family enzyme